MKLYRYKTNSIAIMGILKDDFGGTYFTSENVARAIPCGSYSVSVTHSPRFNCDLPLVVSDALGVSASRGIRIHSGNKASVDSQGCILVANSCDLASSTIADSKSALAQLMRHCGDKLDIVNL